MEVFVDWLLSDANVLGPPGASSVRRVGVLDNESGRDAIHTRGPGQAHMHLGGESTRKERHSPIPHRLGTFYLPASRQEP